MKKFLVAHPFLLGLYPILFLYLYNRQYIDPSEVLLPATIVIGIVFILMVCLTYLLKDNRKAGLILTTFVVIFFSYGHVYNILCWLIYYKTNLPKFRHMPFLIFCATVFILCIIAILRTHRDLRTATRALNIAGGLLVGLSVFQIAWFETWELLHPPRRQDTVANAAAQAGRGSAALCPNIYYIILDAYARADVLKEMYRYDNTEFLDYLTEKGFYIADKSRANYPCTIWSVTSTLNMDYLNDLALKYDPNSKNIHRALRARLYENAVVKFLKKQGYKIVTLAYNRNMFAGVDREICYGSAKLSDFQNLIIESTPLPVLHRKLDKVETHRKRILYPLHHLEETIKIEGPIFVFIHVMAPHQPFVFDRDGRPLPSDGKMGADGDDFHGTREEFVTKYVDQLIFVNNHIKKGIDAVLANSKRPVVMIIQGDHGPRLTVNWREPEKTNFAECFPILNAYLLPNDGAKHLYKSISPVNTFRVIFNLYFGTKYGLLKDESFFVSKYGPLNLIPVPDTPSTTSAIR